MPLLRPRPGLVVRYAYLWRHEHNRGREEGIKDRPCVILGVRPRADGAPMVTVAAITHTPPLRPGAAVAMPLRTKRSLGLDDEASWIVCDEVNRFAWPGRDLRPLPGGKKAGFAYGMLPGPVFEAARGLVLARWDARGLRVVERTD